MSGMSETAPQEQSLPVVAEVLGVDEIEAKTILDQHGYREDANLSEITEEELGLTQLNVDSRQYAA